MGNDPFLSGRGNEMDAPSVVGEGAADLDLVSGSQSKGFKGRAETPVLRAARRSNGRSFISASRKLPAIRTLWSAGFVGIYRVIPAILVTLLSLTAIEAPFARS
jgi:hypothetical protein